MTTSLNSTGINSSSSSSSSNSNVKGRHAFKLLGIYVSDLSWNNHVTYICKCANFRLHFLRVEKGSSILQRHVKVIHPVLEYAAPIWHTGFTAELVDSLKSVQECALRIIFGGNSFTNSTYLSFCQSLAISSLQSRKKILFIKFWNCLSVFTTSSHSQLKKTKKPLVVLTTIHTY